MKPLIAALATLAVAALAIALTSATASEVPEGWMTDLDAAFAKAKKENMSVLVEFTGSDWCPPCIMMRKKVFSQKKFVEAASKNFILVELDFPKGDPDLKKKNDPYAKKYKIEGFPTVILFTAEGTEFNRFFASKFPGIEPFLKHLKKALENKDLT